MPRFLFSLVAAALVCVFAHAADASEEPRIAFRLEYEAPSAENDCPSLEALSLAISHEFGYVVIKPNAPAVLHLELHQVGKRYEAEISGPDPAGGSSEWHHKENRVTCRELVYDVASIVRINYGPSAWGSDTPPEILAARPEIEVGRPALVRIPLRLAEPLAFRVPLAELPASISKQESSFSVEAAFGAVVSPVALPKAALGGDLFFGGRFSRFSINVDIRGAITALSGLGDNDIGGRTSLLTVSLIPCVITGRFLDLCGIVGFSNMRFDLGPALALRQADGYSTGFGARIAPRWPISERFSILGFADGTAEMRSIAVRSQASTGPDGPPPDWISPWIRLTFGVAFATTLVP